MRSDDANPSAQLWLEGRITRDEFIAAVRDPVRIWVRRAGERNSLPPGEFEDAIASVQIAVVRLIILHDENAQLRDSVTNWSALLRQVATRETYRYCAAWRRHGVTGLSSTVKRSARITKTRRELTAKNGYEPTDEQVLAHINATVERTVANPTKAGAFVSEADLHSHTVSTGQDITMANTPIADSAEQISDARLLVDQIVSRCRAHDAQTAQVALVWLEEVPLTGVVHTIAEVRARTSLTAARIREHIGVIKEIAGDILTRK